MRRDSFKSFFSAVCVIVAFAIYLPSEAKTLEEANIQSLKQAFNDASQHVRLVALLSPT